ncbi:hypothetical protein ACE6H2_009463 [Prunus campanulata]
MAASKDACSSSYRCSYHAFLSFRGEDTRKGFTDHLYRALELAGIHTFRDDDEIERGSNIAAELQKAIQESRASIIVFSKDYAASRWCLDELTKIMERSKTEGHMVLPVFYAVDPSHVRNQNGTFAEAFARHEERFKDEMYKVEEWRRALRDVADLGGMVLENRYESQFIKEIVEKIGNKLDHRALNVAPYAVGIDKRVQGLNRWLEDGSNDVGVAVIYGMGGIGKTTISKSAYNLNLDRFQASSFLADVRETSEQPNGLVRLQRKLLSDIQKGKTKKVYNMDEGVIKIKHAVCCKRVLIVLDDVDHWDQFSAVLGMREWFHPGSKIIITTRQEYLLKAHEVSEMFKVQELNEYESLEIFSWHAFGQAHPVEGYMELSRPVVQHCGGLPLALQVLGSSLSGKNVDVWQSAIEKLDMIPHGKIQKFLRISFDSLEDDHDKHLFLHIACFFIGKEKDFTITVLDNCDFYTRIGIQNLVDRCLLKINGENKLVMHQVLRDMGRGIVREESPLDPGKRSRVWSKDSSNIMRKLTGTETIKAFKLQIPMFIEDEPSKTICSGSNKKRCHAEDYDSNKKRRRLGFFSWQSINFSSTSSVVVSNEVDFKTEAFRRMHNLEILLLSNVNINGGYEDFPKHLIWLSWRGFPLKSIPANFYLENLVALELQNSRLEHVWKGTKLLPRLKILNLSHSHSLMTTPDLSGLSNLERLNLNGCINLVEIGESIGNLEKLVFLNLKDCKNLIKLPTSISMLRSLQELILSGCSKLVLHANTTATSTDTDMKKLVLLSTTSWQSIWSWWSWVLPRKVPESRFSLGNLPHFLGRLSLAYCNLSEVPTDLCILSSLQYLNLSGNPILNLPENMNGLIMLQTLLLENCKELQMLPELPPNLKSLQASFCTSLKRVTNVPNKFRSLELMFYQCMMLVEVKSSFNINPLRNIDIEIIQEMGLFNLESIESAEVEMINYSTNTTRKGPLQGLYECGIFSIFLHGSKIPDWFSYRSMGNSVLSIIIPSHLNRKIRGLNACVVYARHPDRGLGLQSQHFVKVSNETKGLKWTYSAVTMGCPEENEDMLWLSHWLFDNNELEGGEEVRVSVDMEYGFSRKEFGIQLVYEQENKGKGVLSNSDQDITIQQEASPWRQNVLGGDVSVSASKYQLQTGKYFLCNYKDQYQFRLSSENPAHLDFQ